PFAEQASLACALPNAFSGWLHACRSRALILDWVDSADIPFPGGAAHVIGPVGLRHGPFAGNGFGIGLGEAYAVVQLLRPHGGHLLLVACAVPAVPGGEFAARLASVVAGFAVGNANASVAQ